MQEAVEACVAFAQEKHRLSVERIADLVGETKWTVYKWMEQGSVPARKIAGLEHACGRAFITQYLATSARKLLVDLPTGRMPTQSDIHAVQQACNTAIGALLAFAQGDATATDTADHLTAAMSLLAHERAQVQRHDQPELDLS
ncbi:hypothetical protein KR767_04170 [Luteibacter anthropi]|uniref:hypothetical protein n=1 Tax=Luteibacter anthropi TaxID=564369 RepID=UPI00203237AD|nr:hypothetical protein [Luteibacter anthropi]URX63273.1 hypothetical protein KR767_04170 [Luteibacter anthropi]